MPVLFTDFVKNICNLILLSDQPYEYEYDIQRFGNYFCVQSQDVDVIIDTSILWFAFMSRSPGFKMYRPM
jgi:hypothetical protein